MATKDSKLKNVIAPSDDTCTSEKVETKNDVASDDHIKETETEIAVVASDDSRKVEKSEEIEKETAQIDLGISLDKLSIGPKKKLVVIPLGGILVHRAHRFRPNTIPKSRRADFSYGNFQVYIRPFCKEFLKFCFERFEVGLWSSAMEHNLDGVLTKVMGELKSKLLFTWDQKHCTNTGFMCLDNQDKPLFLKQLKSLWLNKWRGVEYSASNTLLITDPVKALLNPPNTAIFPGTYDPENKEDDFLGPNGELRAFLDGLAEAKDVQTYVKDHPFGEPAITPSHPDWKYYAKVVRAFGKKETDDSKN